MRATKLSNTSSHHLFRPSQSTASPTTAPHRLHSRALHSQQASSTLHPGGRLGCCRSRRSASTAGPSLTKDELGPARSGTPGRQSAHRVAILCSTALVLLQTHPESLPTNMWTVLSMQAPDATQCHRSCGSDLRLDVLFMSWSY